MADFSDVIRQSLGLPPRLVIPEAPLPETEDFGLPNTIQNIDEFVEAPVADVPVPEETGFFDEGVVEGIDAGLADEPSPVQQARLALERGRSVSAGSGESRKESSGFSVTRPNVVAGTDVDVAGAAQRARSLHRGIKQGLEKKAQGVQAEADAKSAKADALAGILEDDAVAAQQELELEARAQVEAQKATELDMAKLGAAIDQLANMSLNPSRLWNDRGTGTAAAGAAAAFIGGFLTAGGVKNNIQQIIDKAIERDLAAQKADINIASGNVKNLAMLARMGVDLRKDEAKQRGVQRLLRRSAIVAQMKAEAAKYQDPILQAQAAQAIGELEFKNQQEFARLFQITFNQKATEAKLKLSRVLGHQRIAVQRSQAAAAHRRAKVAEDALKFRKDQAEKATKAQFFIPGERTGLRTNGVAGFLANDEKERGKVAEKVVEANDQYENLDIAKRLATGRIGIPGSAARMRFVAQMARIQLKAAEAINGNASDKDLKIVRDTHGGDFDKFFRLASADTIKRVINDSQKNLVANMENFTATLSRNPRINITWVPPKVKDEDERLLSISSFGDMLKNVQKNRSAKAGTEGFRNLNGAVNEMEDQLKKFNIAANPFEAPAAQKAINELFKIPAHKRRMLVNGRWRDDVALYLQSLLEVNKQAGKSAPDPNLSPEERARQKADAIGKQLRGE